MQACSGPLPPRPSVFHLDDLTGLAVQFGACPGSDLYRSSVVAGSALHDRRCVSAALADEVHDGDPMQVSSLSVCVLVATDSKAET
jgi:hypothetical protein